MVPGCSDLAWTSSAARTLPLVSTVRWTERDWAAATFTAMGRRVPPAAGALPSRAGLGLGLAAVAGEPAQEGDQQKGADRPRHTGTHGAPA